MFNYSPFPTQLFSRQVQDPCEAPGKAEFPGFLQLVDFFFISHPPLGQREGRESERVMYFYGAAEDGEGNPMDASMDRQTDITGLAEAVVNFTNSFIDPSMMEGQRAAGSREDPSHTHAEAYPHRFVNSTNCREIILVVEDGRFIIGAGMNRKKCKAAEYFLHPPTLKALMVRCYEAFRLLHGPLNELLAALPLPEFKLRLDRFFTTHLSLLRLNKIPLVDLFAGAIFMPLSNVDYLDVECLVTRCGEERPEVRATMFLYQTRLIQFSVPKGELIALYELLTHILIPFSMRSELQPETAHRSDSRHTGAFIAGISAADDYMGELSEGDGMFPVVHLHGSGTYELIAYRCMNATICLFVEVDARSAKGVDYLSGLADFLDQRMGILASRIGEGVVGVPKGLHTDIPFHFIYFNPDSLSLRTSFASTLAAHSSTAAEPPTSTYNLIYEAYDHFVASESKDFAQIHIKADDGCWIVFKRSNGRILILFISQLNTSSQATIVDVYDISERIIKSHFDHVFI